MNRGIITLGGIECDGCHHNVRYLDRYLVNEDRDGKTSRLCLDCAENKDFVHYRQEKGERVLTFFPRESGLVA
jgi:hypothetical protein